MSAKNKGVVLALIQLAVSSAKKENISRAFSKVKEAAEKGAKIISLPECFNSPYGPKYFSEYAEVVPTGETSAALAKMAAENNVFLIGGSIPERDGEKLFNTCTVWDPDGRMVAKHRKVHLFDIDVPGGIRFQESESLTAGSDVINTFEAFGIKVGLGICYDMRFPEMALLYAQKGCHLLVYPGAFNMTTGPPHWELLQRARALDNQLYVATASPARDTGASYVAWGHSSAVDPWGRVVATTEHDEDIVFANIDLGYLKEVRSMVPVLQQKRKDLYRVQEELSPKE